LHEKKNKKRRRSKTKEGRIENEIEKGERERHEGERIRRI
jgi:hypothetical protein